MYHTLAPTQDALYPILRNVSCNIALLRQQARHRHAAPWVPGRCSPNTRRLAGRPGRTAALERLLDYAVGHQHVCFARRIDIARHWLATYPFTG